MSERAASYRDEKEEKRCWLVQVMEGCFQWAYEKAESKCRGEKPKSKVLCGKGPVDQDTPQQLVWVNKT